MTENELILLIEKNIFRDKINLYEMKIVIF